MLTVLEKYADSHHGVSGLFIPPLCLALLSDLFTVFSCKSEATSPSLQLFFGRYHIYFYTIQPRSYGIGEYRGDKTYPLDSSKYTLDIILQVQICSLWNPSTCLQAMITTKLCDFVPLNKVYYFLRFARFHPELEIVKSKKSSCLATCDTSKAFSGIQWYQPV